MARWFAVVVVFAILGISWWKAQEGSTYRGAPDAPQWGATDASAAASASVSSQPPPVVRSPEADAAAATARINADREAARKSVGAIVEAGRKKLVTRYEGETLDSSWALAKQAELAGFGTSQQIEDIHAEPKNLAIDCRRTVCRINADFGNRSIAQDWAMLYLTGAGSRLANASLETIPNPDGSFRMEIYGLARQ
jgi:hypothetical protein